MASCQHEWMNEDWYLWCLESHTQNWQRKDNKTDNEMKEKMNKKKDSSKDDAYGPTFAMYKRMKSYIYGQKLCGDFFVSLGNAV